MIFVLVIYDRFGGGNLKLTVYGSFKLISVLIFHEIFEANNHYIEYML